MEKKHKEELSLMNTEHKHKSSSFSDCAMAYFSGLCLYQRWPCPSFTDSALKAFESSFVIQ